MTTTVPDEVKREVLALTRSPQYAPIPNVPESTVPSGEDIAEFRHREEVEHLAKHGLRPHPGPVKKGTTVWLYATGRYRPAVVLRESTERAGKRGPVKVVHSTPTSGDRLYVKAVPAHELFTGGPR